MCPRKFVTELLDIAGKTLTDSLATPLDEKNWRFSSVGSTCSPEDPEEKAHDEESGSSPYAPTHTSYDDDSSDDDSYGASSADHSTSTSSCHDEPSRQTAQPSHHDEHHQAPASGSTLGTIFGIGTILSSARRPCHWRSE